MECLDDLREDLRSMKINWKRIVEREEWKKIVELAKTHVELSGNE